MSHAWLVLMAVESASALLVEPTRSGKYTVGVRRSARCALCNMIARPGTLNFSNFKGYFVVLDDGGENMLIPVARVGKGLIKGDAVVFDDSAAPDEPLVKLAVSVAETAEANAAKEAIEAAAAAKAAAKAAEEAREAAAQVAVAVEETETASGATRAAILSETSNRRQVATFLVLVSMVALVSKLGSTVGGIPEPHEAPADELAARIEREEAKAAAKAEAELINKQRADAEKAVADAKAAAAAAAEEAAVAAAWILQWSIPGEAPYFLNTRTEAATWVEPHKGLLTEEALKRAKEAAEEARIQDSFYAQRAYNMLERLNGGGRLR